MACQSCSQILVLFQWVVTHLMVSTIEMPYLSECRFFLQIAFACKLKYWKLIEGVKGFVRNKDCSSRVLC